MILDGEEAEVGEFPWIVTIQEPLGDGEFQHLCAGTILNKEWVLTVECIRHSVVLMSRIVAGEHNQSLEEGTEQIRQIVQMVDHPDYQYAKK